MRSLFLIVLLLAWPSLSVRAGNVETVFTVFIQQGDGWQVSTTLRHEDTGWEHYADAWRVVDEGGKVLGTRELLHPHKNEQPFTRSLDGIVIPPETYIVYVEAHDKVHGWSPQRVRVDLRQRQGPRFQVQKE